MYTKNWRRRKIGRNAEFFCLLLHELEVSMARHWDDLEERKNNEIRGSFWIMFCGFLELESLSSGAWKTEPEPEPEPEPKPNPPTTEASHKFPHSAYIPHQAHIASRHSRNSPPESSFLQHILQISGWNAHF